MLVSASFLKQVTLAQVPFATSRLQKPLHIGPCLAEFVGMVPAPNLGHGSNGPMGLAIAILLALLPASALRENPKPESLVSDGCQEEAQNTKKLLENLGYKGSLDGKHCDWPGVSCSQDQCRVWKVECQTCHGHLPRRINLRHLMEVLLTSPNLTGDLMAFEGLGKLEKLQLPGTQVHGDIADILKAYPEGSWPRLLVLNLQQTQVHGDLQSIRDLPYLEKVHLADTQVSGRLDLLNESWFHAIDLSRTAVTGDLRDLVGVVTEDGLSQDLQSLQMLKLSNTQVTGNLQTLQFFPSITWVDLSYTQVEGCLSESWRGRFPWLQTLQLRNSRVHFAPGEDLMKLMDHRTSAWKVILPQLTHLDVSDCPVNSSVETLLLPLALSPLASVKAAGAGITGALPDLKGVEATVDGENVSDFTYRFVETLMILDLSRNNVSHILDLPVRPKLGRVFLRENHQLKIEPWVLTEAAKQDIFLDLSWTRVTNEEAMEELVAQGVLQTTDMYAYRSALGGYACKDVTGSVKATPTTFLPEKLCKCLPGWHGHGATCQMCPADKFSDDMGLHICKMCPANSTAPAGSTTQANCKCQFGDLHNGICSCDKHQTFQDGNCILCSKLHLQCDIAGIRASAAQPEVGHARLAPKAEEARRCLPPDASQRCPGSHQCGLGYTGTLCTSCADGFRAEGGRCKPCEKSRSAFLWGAVALGVAVLLLAAFLGYRRYRQHVPSTPQSAPAAHAEVRQLGRLLLLQAPGLLQTVQLWSVLSQPGRSSGTSGSNPGLIEIPYLETLQLTINDVQNSLSMQCKFPAETVRTVAALGSPLLPLLLLACCAALELRRAGLGVNAALKVLPFVFIGGAYSTAALLSCEFQDGDGESLGEFAFRKALPQLRCYDRTGVGFWIDVVGYSSAVAYGVLIPLFLAGLMVRQYFAFQQARLCYAYAEGGPQHVTLRLQTLRGELPKHGLPKRLLAAVAAYMAVHCRGKRLVQLQEGYITATSEEDIEEVQQLSLVKVMADAETSKDQETLRSRRLGKMLTERIMLDEAEDRLLIGSQSLLCKYTLSQDLWIYVVIKLYAVALVCCISMSDAWKWAIAFSLGMALLVGVGQPYMWPQVSQLQSFSCLCLAVASVAFAYDFAWLARLGLLAPLLLLLWQVRCPDCTAALAERLYQELESELPKLQRGESHEVNVQKLSF